MDPLANAFTPGLEYEIPSSWDPGQRPKVRHSSAASVPVSEDYSDLPPVIHRFQKSSMDTSAILKKAKHSTENEGDYLSSSSLLDTEPEVQSPSPGSMKLTTENDLLAKVPFQVVNRTKPSKFGVSTPQKASQLIKSTKDSKSDENTGEGSCKSCISDHSRAVSKDVPQSCICIGSL